MSRAYIETFVERVREISSHQAKDTLSVEEPLKIQLGYDPADARETKSISVTMRTPGYDFELVAGFLMTEGVTRGAHNGVPFSCKRGYL
jgi:FdhD protein